MVVDKYVGRCLDVGSIPTGSIFIYARGWDKCPSLLTVFGLSSKTQWLSGLYYADFISFYSPTQLCGGGTTKSNSNELPISVPLSFCFFKIHQAMISCELFLNFLLTEGALFRIMDTSLEDYSRGLRGRVGNAVGV